MHQLAIMVLVYLGIVGQLEIIECSGVKPISNFTVCVSVSEFSSQGNSPSPVVYSHKMDPIFLPPNIGIMTLRSTV
jgi:hypothetical protein